MLPAPSLKKIVGRKLAARVLKTWTEDFVDEDTGEVVSIDRNEVVLERDHILTEDDIEIILESGTKSIILHKDDVNITDYRLSLIRSQKTTQTLRKKRLNRYIDNLEILKLLMSKQQGILFKVCSLVTRDMILGKLVDIESTRN